MATLTIRYEDGSTQKWGLTEREADVSSFAIERLFGKPSLNHSKKEVPIAQKEGRRRT